ncbi:MAG: hypothetical protein ACUVWZ_00050 [Anaerolineae bacterium]
MDCPHCGVYNPEGRQVCWRCDQELPKTQELKKQMDPVARARRMWIVAMIALCLWVLLTLLWWLVFSRGAVPIP